MRTTLTTALLVSTAIAAPQATNYATSGTSAGVVPVGGNCTPNQDTCAGGSQCYATNSMLQPRCGNFQAACTINEQCAFNTCNVQQGLCNGFLSSIGGPSSTRSATSYGSVITITSSSASATGTTTISSTRTVTATTTVTGVRNGTMTIRPTGSLRPTESARPSRSVVPYTGSASAAGVGSGLLAVVFAIGAWAL